MYNKMDSKLTSDKAEIERIEGLLECDVVESRKNRYEIRVLTKHETPVDVWDKNVQAVTDADEGICQGRFSREYIDKSLREADVLVVATHFHTSEYNGEEYYVGDAFAVGKLFPDGAMLVSLVCSHLGLGLGTAILMKVEQYARQLKAETIVLEALMEASPFYYHMGYRFQADCSLAEDAAIHKVYTESVMPFLRKHNWFYRIHLDELDAKELQRFIDAMRNTLGERITCSDRTGCNSVTMMKCLGKKYKLLPPIYEETNACAIM